MKTFTAEIFDGEIMKASDQEGEALYNKINQDFYRALASCRKELYLPGFEEDSDFFHSEVDKMLEKKGYAWLQDGDSFTIETPTHRVYAEYTDKHDKLSDISTLWTYIFNMTIQEK